MSTIDNSSHSPNSIIYETTTSSSTQSTVDPNLLLSGNSSWLLISTSLVLLMVPGLSFFYAGLASHKNSLSMLILPLISLTVVSVQWWCFGYSLAFGDGNSFIGGFHQGGWKDIGIGATSIPSSSSSSSSDSIFSSSQFTSSFSPVVSGGLYAVFQGMFAAITPALAFGSTAGRMRIAPVFPFLLLWTTFVYDFIARWIWSPSRWVKKNLFHF